MKENKNGIITDTADPGAPEKKERRARHKLSIYRSRAKRKGKECTITSEWILENIFNSSCLYCGETDWTVLGCDRIDNTKGYTPDNIVCSCNRCNRLRSDRRSVQEFRTVAKDWINQTTDDRRERQNAYSKKYYEEHKEELREAMKRWREEHPDYHKQYRKHE